MANGRAFTRSGALSCYVGDTLAPWPLALLSPLAWSVTPHPEHVDYRVTTSLSSIRCGR